MRWWRWSTILPSSSSSSTSLKRDAKREVRAVGGPESSFVDTDTLMGVVHSFAGFEFVVR